jgi:Ca-activated chloride channel family protein
MKLSIEDPRLTAYALDEIEDANERAEIERAIATSPELQAVVAATRETGDLLIAGLARENTPTLSEFDKARLSQCAQPKLIKRFAVNLRQHWRLVAGLAAACLAAAVVWLPKLQDSPIEYVYHHAEQNEYAYHHAEQNEYARSQIKIDGSVETLESSNPFLPQHYDEKKEKESQLVLADTSSLLARVVDSEIVSSGPDRILAYSLPAAPAYQAAPEEVVVSAAQVAQNRKYSVDTLALRRTERPVPRYRVRSTDNTTDNLIANSEAAPASSAVAAISIPRSSQSTLREGYVAPMQPLATFNTESYDPIEETDFRSPLVAPLSTFSIDVDTASYANMRRFLQQGQLPPSDAVRIEELINYFSYADAPPTDSLGNGGDPFAVHMAQSTAPWNAEHHLLRIALKGYEMPWAERPASNLVFLLDVSGSMNDAHKLPLVKDAMDLLIRRLDKRDRVAIVVYAGASGLVLPSTTANNHETIAHALENLKAGGSTNGGAGIELAYATAREHFIKGGNNRVILCTDGDFNIGQTNRSSLAEKVEIAAAEGISLTVLGFGMHNYKDDMLETLSNKGKGSYAYIDSSAEARKVFLQDLPGNLFKIAKDVKVQVEFNPEQVKAYRLIGYENRRLKAEDFNNDAKNAGDIGPGHSIVALYEIVPRGAALKTGSVDPLRYQSQPLVDSKPDAEVATVKLRYKQPEGSESRLITGSVQSDSVVTFANSSEDFRFTAAVAAFGLRLTDSEHLSEYSYREIESVAIDALGTDPGGHRSEFTELVRKAESIYRGRSTKPALR